MSGVVSEPASAGASRTVDVSGGSPGACMLISTYPPTLHVVRVDDALDERAGHGGVDGVAAPRQDAGSGLGGERLGRDDHASHAGLSIGADVDSGKADRLSLG